MPDELVGLEKKRDYYPSYTNLDRRNPMSRSLNFEPGQLKYTSWDGQLASASEFKDDMNFLANSGSQSLYRNVSMLNFPKKEQSSKSWMAPEDPYTQKEQY